MVRWFLHFIILCFLKNLLIVSVCLFEIQTTVIYSQYHSNWILAPSYEVYINDYSDVSHAERCI